MILAREITHSRLKHFNSSRHLFTGSGKDRALFWSRD